MVGLENGPVIPGEGTWQGLPRSSDKEQGGLGVDNAVLQTQVRVKKEGEAFQLCAEQTVFIGLINRETETREKSHKFIIHKHDEDRNASPLYCDILQFCHISTATDTQVLLSPVLLLTGC